MTSPLFSLPIHLAPDPYKVESMKLLLTETVGLSVAKTAVERSIVLELQGPLTPSTICHCNVYRYPYSNRATVDLNFERELLSSPVYEFLFPTSKDLC